jgi:uncharacterized protein (TIGR04168 family)
MEFKIAIIGDIHGSWSLRDVRDFNRSDYDMLLFVGDLPSKLGLPSEYKIASLLGELKKPAFLMPGNHDGTSLFQLVCEVLHIPYPFPGEAESQFKNMNRLKQCLGSVAVVGYSHHTLFKPLDLGLISARPHSMGGGLNFKTYLSKHFGVASMDESSALLRDLVDSSPHRRLIILAHNGPFGLGESSTAPFSADFGRGKGDWGDRDLRDAVEYAKTSGKAVLAVIAGHMHHLTNLKTLRTWKVVRDDTVYINAAKCPRIYNTSEGRFRHHIRLVIDENGCNITEENIPDLPNQ